MGSKQVKQILAVVIPTLGGGTAVYFVLNQQVGKAILSFTISFIWGIIAIGGTFLRQVRFEVDQKLKERAAILAEWIVSNLETFVLKLWWRLTSRFRGDYYKSLIYRYRTYRTEGLKTKGKFALDMAEVFIPLRVAAQGPDLISPIMMQAKNRQPKRLEIWDFLGAFADKPAFRHIAVIGAPGCGKTSLLEYLALTYALKTHRRQHRRAPTLTPILLYLRDIRNEIIGDDPPSLPQVVENQEFVKRLRPPPNWFQNKLRHNQCLVMLDGLDEVADEEQRNLVSRWINRQMVEYADTPFILTSRPFGFKNAPLEQIGIVLEVQPFNLREIEQFIRNWYLQSEVMRQLRKEDAGVRELAKRQADDLISRIKNNAPLAAMAVNPLLLTMIATVHDNRGALPGRRVELYAEICDVLLGRRQEAKNIPDLLTAKQKQVVLQVLAFELMKKETRQFTLKTGALLIMNVLATVAGPKASADDFLRHVADVSGLIIERELGIHEFAHKSFQEYLAAAQVKEIGSEGALIRNINQSWWEETIRLYAAQGDATNLIQAALDLPSIDTLSLAYDCLEEGGRVSPAVRRRLEDKLEAGFASDQPEVARLATEVRLSRRLNRLLRIDEGLEIDTGCITCAEYQLFIDQKRKEGQFHQPDHWPTLRFPDGSAAEPITGIRSSDALDFCEWLNHQYPSHEFKYRIPTFEELKDNAAAESEVGNWCRSGKKKIIAGVSQEQWRVWEKDVVEAFKRDLTLLLPVGAVQNHSMDHLSNIPLDRALDVTAVGNWQLHRNRSLVFGRDLQRALDMTLVRDQKRDLVFLRRLIRSLAVALDIDLHEFSPALASALKWSSTMDIVSASTWIRGGLLLISSLTTHSNPRKMNSSQLTEFFQELSRSLHSEQPTKSQVVFGFYVYFLVITRRQQHKMPAWEGIRIVRERIE